MSSDFDISTDAKGRLVLHRPGQEDLPEVRIRRAFPWSHPDHFISIRNKEGKEVLLIDDLSKMTGPAVGKVREALRTAGMIPKISRVVDFEWMFGLQNWSVETDRGPIEFKVQEREDVRFMPDGRISIKDVNGNIYELMREREMDARTQRLLEQLL